MRKAIDKLLKFKYCNRSMIAIFVGNTAVLEICSASISRFLLSPPEALPATSFSVTNDKIFAINSFFVSKQRTKVEQMSNRPTLSYNADKATYQLQPGYHTTSQTRPLFEDYRTFSCSIWKFYDGPSGNTFDVMVLNSFSFASFVS